MNSCDDNSESQKPATTCHRFFGYSKRIPRDVKRHCGMCRQHGVVVETRGHICQFKRCICEKCELIRQRRFIMSSQIRLRREQDKKFQRTTNASEADVTPSSSVSEGNNRDDTNLCYFCQKCKNHGILMWKRDHKRNCKFASCHCEQCELIDTRRALDRHIKRNKATNDAISSDCSTLSTSKKFSIGYDTVSNIITFPTMNVFSNNEMTPLLTFNDISLPKPTTETTPTLLPTSYPALLPAVQYPSTSGMAQFPSSSVIYGALPLNPSDLLIANMLNAFSPFEIQLLLGSTQQLSSMGVSST